MSLSLNIKSYLPAIIFIVIALPITFVPSYVLAATTLYWFNNGVDAQWTTLTGNWWNDADHTSQASSLPTSVDVVVTVGTPGTGPNVNLDTWNVPASINAGATDITFTDDYEQWRSIYINITASTTFNGLIHNYGIITGTTTFSGTSWNSGTINGNAIFKNYSHNQQDGAVTGNATFHDFTDNNGIVNGDAVFFGEGLSENIGSIYGNAIFSGLSANAGVVLGTAKFMYATDGVITIPDGGKWDPGTSHANIGSDNIPITLWVFDGLNYNSGTVTGTAKFTNATGGVITIPDGGQWDIGTANSNVGVDDAPITSWVFYGSSYINYGTTTGDATFNDSSSNQQGVVDGNAIFNDSSSNDGIVTGDATFNGDSSENYGDEDADVYGTKIRQYNSVIKIHQDFVTDGPWTVLADGATVDVSESNYDTDPKSPTYTTFYTLNGGHFIGSSIIIISIPTVTTRTASLVTSISATLNGRISVVSDSLPTVRGFAYGTASDLTTNTSTSTDGGSFPIGNFTFNTSNNGNLTCNTTYYARAYATNVAGTSFGSIVSFLTSACISVVTTPSVSSSVPVHFYGGGRQINYQSQPVTVLSINNQSTTTSNKLPATSNQPQVNQFKRYLSLGFIGNDVKALQVYLNTHGFKLSSVDNGSPGHETTFFGTLTKSALTKFQKAHRISAVGIFGPITMKYINANL